MQEERSRASFRKQQPTASCTTAERGAVGSAALLLQNSAPAARQIRSADKSLDGLTAVIGKTAPGGDPSCALSLSFLPFLPRVPFAPLSARAEVFFSFFFIRGSRVLFRSLSGTFAFGKPCSPLRLLTQKYRAAPSLFRTSTFAHGSCLLVVVVVRRRAGLRASLKPCSAGADFT